MTASTDEAGRAGDHRARAVALPVTGGALSGLLAEPPGAPRGTIVALHGAGMSAHYFDAAGHHRSLLAAAARRGLRALALDRPGYGSSRAHLPYGLGILDQAAVVAEALTGFLARRPDEEDGDGWLALYGHSFGGKVVLALAAHHPELSVRHVEVCGLGERYAVSVDATRIDSRAAARLHWGPLRYPPGTILNVARHVAEPTPPHERAELGRWEDVVLELAGQVTCPLHFTFGQHEGWWRCADHDRRQLGVRFTRATVGHSLLAATGHNASLGYTAAAHHEAVLDRVASALSCD